MKSITLAFDIGTTKTAAVLLDCQSKTHLAFSSVVHNAGVVLPDGRAEQSIEAHKTAILEAVHQLPAELRHNVTCISSSGQMHGVVLWNTEKTSPLFTWQDHRPNSEEIRKIQGCSGLKDGFGLLTLACLDTSSFDHCGTIHDYFLWLFSDQKGKVQMDPTNAASWGLFNIESNTWNIPVIQTLGIPISILPSIVKSGSRIGSLSSEFAELFEINPGIPIYSAVGDNQASIIGTQKDNSQEIYLTIGTSEQLSLVVDHLPNIGPHAEIRPFPGDKFLVVTAVLAGGECWKWLKNFVKSLMETFGQTFDDNFIYSKLDELALPEIDSTDLPMFAPHFCGERWDEHTFASISNITLHNFSLGKIAASLALGMIQNVSFNLDKGLFLDKKYVIANGNAVRRSKALQKAIEKVFNLPVQIHEGVEEAACGAAILANLIH